MNKLLPAFLILLSYSISFSDDIGLNNGYILENVQFVDTLNGMVRYKGQDIVVSILPSQILSRQHEDGTASQPAKIFIINKRQYKEYQTQNPAAPDTVAIQTIVTRHGEMIRSSMYRDEDSAAVFVTEYGLVSVPKELVVEPKRVREDLMLKNPLIVTMANRESFTGEPLSTNDSTSAFQTSMGSVTVLKKNILSIRSISKDIFRQVPAAESMNVSVIDSTLHLPPPAPVLQFQLIGGLGIYYIGPWSPSSSFRIGADVSLHHSDQSGDSASYSSPPPFSTIASGGTGQPKHTSNSYEISLSALDVEKLFAYKQTFIYCGIGPLVRYSWARSINDGSSISGGIQYYTDDEYSTEKTDKILAVGPMVIFGVRSVLIDRVSVSAEIGISAMEEWSTHTFSSTDTYTYAYTSSPASSSTDDNGGISNLKGWDISLYAVRIGLVIEL